jgi:hypothetical protein
MAKIRQQKQYSIANKTKPRYLLITGLLIYYLLFFLTGGGTTFFFA